MSPRRILFLFTFRYTRVGVDSPILFVSLEVSDRRADMGPIRPGVIGDEAV